MKQLGLALLNHELEHTQSGHDDEGVSEESGHLQEHAYQRVQTLNLALVQVQNEELEHPYPADSLEGTDVVDDGILNHVYQDSLAHFVLLCVHFVYFGYQLQLELNDLFLSDLASAWLFLHLLQIQNQAEVHGFQDYLDLIQGQMNSGNTDDLSENVQEVIQKGVF